MQEQDQQLDGVMHTVLNMREIATTMNTELQDQSMLLDDLDEHVDRTSSKLQKAMKRMNHFIKQNEGTEADNDRPPLVDLSLSLWSTPSWLQLVFRNVSQSTNRVCVCMDAVLSVLRVKGFMLYRDPHRGSDRPVGYGDSLLAGGWSNTHSSNTPLLRDVLAVVLCDFLDKCSR